MTAALQHRAAPTPASLKAGLSDAVASTVTRLQALAEARERPPFGAPAGSALPTLEALFGLSDVELELLCLAAGRDIDDRLGDAIRALAGGSAVTAGLVERLHGPSAWSALSSGGALRHWSLIELRGDGPLRDRAITLDERILGFLLGENWPDRRLTGIVRPVAAGLPAGAGLEDETAGMVDALTNTGEAPLLLLSGRDAAARRACLADAAAQIGSVVWRLDARDIPTDWTQRHALGVFLDREMALTRSVLLIEVEEADAEAGPAARLADALVGPVALSANEAARPERMPQVRFDLPAADIQARRAEWNSALGPHAAALGNEVDRLASHFTMGSAMIQAACATAVRAADGPGLSGSIWAAARVQSRGRLDGLAQRIDARVPWDDLVLPPEQLAILKDMAGHLRHAARVNHDWGWSDKGSRGLGAATLFSGPSGTGKTLAAEILATELALDLYRIDLSQTVSKYIGETEKNLSRIFAAAEQSGAILLFDEADALFGKRSEVKDSHDRYANVEVSYLLQRMEAYRGLAVLTTNLKSAVDKAFLRRLRYLVTFPFPDAAARAEIWTRVFPRKTPLDGLDIGRLSRLGISGGTIRSIALNAAYLAAAEDSPVRMEHVRRAARREYAKIEKPFTAAEAEACG